MKRTSVFGFAADKIYFRKSSAFIRKIKAVGALFLISAVIAVQVPFFFGYEAHIINVTAKICNYAEIRSIGYWKNHPEIYAYYLPQSLGDMIIDDEDKADGIFNFSGNARSAANKLMAQLLGMKFNIANFGIGDYAPEGDTRTLSRIVAEADNILRDPDSTKEETLAMKDLLDRLNNLEKIKYCAGVSPEQNAYSAAGKVSEDADETSRGKKKEISGGSIEEETEGLAISDTLPADGIVGSGSADNQENASAYTSGNSEAAAVNTDQSPEITNDAAEESASAGGADLPETAGETLVEKSNILADSSQIPVSDPAINKEILAETSAPDNSQTETAPANPAEETAPSIENSLEESVLPAKDTEIIAISESAGAPSPDDLTATEAESFPIESANDSVPSI